MNMGLQVNESRILLAHLRVQPIIIENVKNVQIDDPQLVKIMEEAKKGDLTDFRIQDNGALRFGNCFCVPNDSELKKEIMEETMDPCILFTQKITRCINILGKCIGGIT